MARGTGRGRKTAACLTMADGGPIATEQNTRWETQNRHASQVSLHGHPRYPLGSGSMIPSGVRKPHLPRKFPGKGWQLRFRYQG